MMEAVGAGLPMPRAFLRVAGATVAHHQLGLVLALGCQRVICLVRGTSAEVIALQHAAEDAGLQFHLATMPRQLSSLVTAADELVVIGDGLLADPAAATALVDEEGPAVLVQPVEGALEQGYERIDLNTAGAALMRLPGRLVEHLHELPADCDASSALMRIALQAGVPMRQVPSAARSGINWRLVRTEQEAHELEDAWLRARFGPESATSPGRALARFAMLGFGSSLLHAGNASAGLSVGVLAMLGLAAGFGWFGFGLAAFLCCAVAWVMLYASRLMRDAERQILGQLPPAIPRADALGWAIDATIMSLALIESQSWPRESLASWLFPPMMLALLLQLVPRLLPQRLSSLVSDRAVLCLLLALVAGFGQVLVTVQAICVILVLSCVILAPHRHHG